MTPVNQHQSANQVQVGLLTETRYVFHAWQNLSLVVPDGIMCSIDTKEIDVDFDGKGGGINHIKRLRLVPMTTTQTPVINNREGFAVSNMFVGSFGVDGQPSGLGSNMTGSRKSNVRGEWHYPGNKLSELSFTFGKYGLVGINSLIGYDPKSKERCQEIFALVMSGIGKEHLLEDLPEYFANEEEEGITSVYLPDKRPARFRLLAREVVERAADKGVEVEILKVVPDKNEKSGYKAVRAPKLIKLNAEEYTNALNLVDELKYSVLGSHAAALDPDNNGVLPQTQAGLQNKKKTGYDALDKFLMRQFPSYPMDTDLEKSQKQLIRALEATAGPASDQVPPGYVAYEEYEALLRKNEELKNSQDNILERLEALEKGK